MKITSGKIPFAQRVVVYGPEGIGKTTFASQFPDPVFIDTEGGTRKLDVKRLPKPTSWQMVKEEVKYVRDTPGVCGTLVLDTADWAERMCTEYVCNKDKSGDDSTTSGIEKFGYGKGYRYVYDEFATLVDLLSDVVEKGTNVVVTAHAAMRKFEQPDELGAYDRWEMKLISTPKCSISAMLKEWADMVLFANYKTHTVITDKEGKKKKAMGTGQRVMYTTHHSCWDAKNRDGLPDMVDFDYGQIAHVIPGTAVGPRKTPQPSPTPEKREEKPKVAPVPAPVQAPEPETKTPEPEPLPDPGAMEGFMQIPGTGTGEPDKRIPKALRDLMVLNHVDEASIKAVVGARGYFPGDMEIWEYPPDFIDGCLVGAWEQVYGMVQEMLEKEIVPFP